MFFEKGLGFFQQGLDLFYVYVAAEIQSLISTFGTYSLLLAGKTQKNASFVLSSARFAVTSLSESSCSCTKR